ncbi:MAG: acylphosphatase [Chloroflexi bacterium]|nr:acylphosphatase [Chloroflexota bacterium]
MRLCLSIYGNVQGVGFRWFARTQAQVLGCTGYVRNHPDGDRVELVAEADRAVLEQLASRLLAGPPGSRVDGSEAQWLDSTGEFAQFQIRH